MSPRSTYWVSLLTPLVILGALAVFFVAVFAENCEVALLFSKPYLLECSLK